MVVRQRLAGSTTKKQDRCCFDQDNVLHNRVNQGKIMKKKDVTGAPVQPIVRRPQQYWYDPKGGKAWMYDGAYGGDQKFIRLTDTDEMIPIFDVLQRLWSEGCTTREQDGEWHLFRQDGEGMAVGKTFRDLCVNILLAGI